MDFRGYAPLSPDQIQDLLDLSRSAAAVICDYYARFEGDTTAQHREKADRTPLTEADLASHRILSEGLARLFPSLPILSEESPAAEIRDRRSWANFWMVDPLDGTREFLERSGHFTINIALIKNQRAVLGLLYQPLADTACLGIVGEGAWKYVRADDRWVARPIRTRTLGGGELVLLASRRHRNDKLATTTDFLEASHRVGRRNSGSALKFCDLASGKGDCYPRFSPCSEWDVAAGDALVSAAGGRVLGLDGEPLRYNARDTLLSPHFLAVGDPDAALWPELLRRLQ